MRPTNVRVRVRRGYRVVYVSDSSNHRISVFDLSGAFICNIGGPHATPPLPDGLVQPQGLALSRDGTVIYVADAAAHVVKVCAGDD